MQQIKNYYELLELVDAAYDAVYADADKLRRRALDGDLIGVEELLDMLESTFDIVKMLKTTSLIMQEGENNETDIRH